MSSPPPTTANGRAAAAARPPNPSMPYRDDCWSEGETSTLVDAWGDRYLDLNRGHLRQKNWQEVADAVNSRRAANRRPPRTDVQCKYRIDTLKKKYKTEKARIADGGAASQWRFFDQLDNLIRVSSSENSKPEKSSARLLAMANKNSSSRSPSPAGKDSSSRLSSKSNSPPLALPLPFSRNNNNSPLPSAAAFRGAGDARMKSALPSMEEEDSEESEVGWRAKRGKEGDGVRQLSWAINRFADIYERVELSKQRHMVEMEKQRMEFAKALEFQRMKMFVDSQVQLEKIKRAKRYDDADS